MASGHPGHAGDILIGAILKSPHTATEPASEPQKRGGGRARPGAVTIRAWHHEGLQKPAREAQLGKCRPQGSRSLREACSRQDKAPGLDSNSPRVMAGLLLKAPPEAGLLEKGLWRGGGEGTLALEPQLMV